MGVTVACGSKKFTFAPFCGDASVHGDERDINQAIHHLEWISGEPGLMHRVTEFKWKGQDQCIHRKVILCQLCCCNLSGSIILSVISILIFFSLIPSYAYMHPLTSFWLLFTSAFQVLSRHITFPFAFFPSPHLLFLLYRLFIIDLIYTTFILNSSSVS